MASGNDVGYYTLPVILSMEGVERSTNSKLSKIFGDVGKKAGKSMADGAEADIKRATDAYAKLRDRAQDALGKVRVEEEKLAKARAGGKQDQIVAAEERLNKARRDSARVNREAIASYDKIGEAQKRLADSTGGLFSKIKGTAGAAGGAGAELAGGFVDGFGGPIAALGSKAGPIGVALAATAGLGLLAGKVLADQVLAGMDQLQGQADVAAKLGLSVDQVKPIAKAAADAYVSNWGDSVADNMDAARAAIQGGLLDTNASAADVQKIVEQLSTVAAVTGEEIPAAVRTAQQAVRTGLAGSYDEAFDLIVKAQQKGLNVSGDLFDTINEYGTQFRKLGLSGPEAFGLISQAVRGGARDADVAADAIKEFSIRSIDGSKSTGEAIQALGLSWKATTAALAAGGDTAKATFQEVVNRIAAIEDPAQRAKIQVALFGTQAEDLGAALNAMNLGTAVDELGQVEGAAQKAADTIGDTAAAKVESAKRSIEVSVDAIQQSLAEVAGPALQSLADWVIAHREEITDFFVTVGHVAIDAGAFIVQSFGDAVSMIGQIIQPIGDVQGAMLKFQAWQADIRGDTETAAQLREQAEEAFGWGEGLTEAGDAMKAIDPTKLHEALDGAAAKAQAAGENTADLTGKIDELDGKDIEVPISVDTSEASAELDDFFKQYNEMTINPQLGDPTGLLGGALLGAGVDTPAGVAGRTGSEAGLTQTTTNLKRIVENQFPAIQSIGGWRPKDGFNEHFNGQAIDIMVPDYGSAGGTAYGDKILKYILGNAGALGVDYVLWQQRQWNADGTSSAMSDRGSPTQNHMDHLHAHTVGTPQLPGASAPRPKPSTPSVTMPSAPSASIPAAAASTPGLSSAIDTSGLQLPSGNDALINAYGPGFEPGIGTPGRDEYGEPGYFRVDPKALREARQRAEDAQYAIAEADAAAQDARAARAALSDDPNADATAIAGADKSVRDAERRAALARREAADAAADAAEVAKGSFTKAKEAQKQKQAKTQRGGGTGLGGLGSIFSSFLTDTFGIGDWLPGLDNFMPLQMADTLLGAFLGPMMNGQTDETGGTSSAPFGIPDIAAPPMPANGQHGGSGGAPGPAIINVDQSQNFTNSPLGWDPAKTEKERNNNINRAPRLPVGIGS